MPNQLPYEQPDITQHPKFQSLSPKAQQIVLDKYSKLTPEIKQSVNQKLFAQPKEVTNEPGLQDVTLKAGVEAPFMAADIAGEKAAEKIGKTGHPLIGGAVGGTIQTLPYALMAGKAIMKTPAIAEGISRPFKAVGEFLNRPGEAEARLSTEEMMSRFRPNQAQNKLRTLAESMIEQPTKNIGQAKQAITQVGIEHEAKKAGLEAFRQESGKEMGRIESKIGVEFKSTPEFERFLKQPGKVAKFASQMEKIGNTSPEELAAKHAPKDLQLWRKTAQEATKKGGLSDLANASMQKGREAAAQALELQSKEFGIERSTYKGILNKLDALPIETKARQSALRKYVISEQEKLSTIKREITDLKKAASAADKAEAADIKQKAIKMIREGQQQDKKIKYLKWAVVGTALGGGGTVAKRLITGQ